MFIYGFYYTLLTMMNIHIQLTIDQQHLIKLDEIVKELYTDRSKFFRKMIDEQYALIQMERRRIMEEFNRDEIGEDFQG